MIENNGEKKIVAELEGRRIDSITIKGIFLAYNVLGCYCWQVQIRSQGLSKVGRVEGGNSKMVFLYRISNR